MGISSAQNRLLALTAIKSDNNLRLSQLAMQKERLADDMLKVSSKYRESLNAKSLKWTNNGGVNCRGISYSGLMRPGEANNWVLYMLTDMNGRVVVDNGYKKYAELISRDGSPGGNWESNKGTILGGLLGFGQGTYQQGLDAEAARDQAQAEIDRLEGTEPSIDNPTYGLVQKSTDDLFAKIGTAGSINFTDKNATVTYDDFRNNIDAICAALEQYFPGNEDYFTSEKNSLKAVLKNIPNSANLTVQVIIDQIFGALKNHSLTATVNGKEEIKWYDTSNTEKYNRYTTDHDNWKAAYDAAVERRNNAQIEYDTIFGPEVRKQMDFYETLFSSIAEKGWKEYTQVSDDDYLNQMLQNGLFSITTVSEEITVNDDGTTSPRNIYQTDLALNCPNIVQVNDEEIRDKALADYEYEKLLIQDKEEKVDLRMENLKTEQDAIKQMIKSIEETKDKNIDKTFELFA